VSGFPWDFGSPGEVRVFLGPFIDTGMQQVFTEPDAVLLGEDSGDRAGHAIVGLGDVDGDGTDDFAVGAYASDVDDVEYGAVFVVRGPIVGGGLLADVGLEVRGAFERGQAGRALTASPPGPQPGAGSLLVGARGYGGTRPGVSTSSSAILAVAGGSGTSTSSTSAWRSHPSSPSPRTGSQVTRAGLGRTSATASPPPEIPMGTGDRTSWPAVSRTRTAGEPSICGWAGL